MPKQTIYKTHAYIAEMRACLNFVCPKCLNEALNDGFDIKVVGEAKTHLDKAYWCDNCGIGNDHIDYREKMDASLKRKGII